MDGRGVELHLYGFVRAGTRVPDVRGIEESAIDVVEHGGLAAVVSPASTPPRPSRAALLGHTGVLMALLDAGSVIPVRFGHRVQDTDGARGLLAEHEAELTDLLTRFEERVEVQVTVTYVEEWILRDIASADPNVRRLQAAIHGRSPTATLPERMALGEHVMSRLEARRDHDRELVWAVLAPHACDVVHSTGEELDVLRANLLVDRASIADLDRSVTSLASERVGRMHVRSTGPLPPYSFVSTVAM